MMYARTEFLYAVLLVASFLMEGSQATHQVRAVTLVTGTASASQTATLSFRPLPEPTSCASTTFSWTYTGPEEPLMLQVTNMGVPQVAPPSTTASSTTSSSTTSSSIATTRLLERAPSIPISNLTLITLVENYDPSLLSYVWNTVNVSQGWYVLSATISTVPISQTVTQFYVRTGTNISCLALTGIISPTNSHTPTITRSSSSLSSQPATSNSAADLSSSSSSKVPTIVGVTVGMAILLLSLLILWFFLARKRKSRTINGGSIKNNFNRWKGSKDSRGGFDANVPTKRYRSSRSHLTSQLGSVGSTFGPEFEDSIIGPEKKSPDEHGVVLSTLPVLHNQSSRTRPDHTYSPSSSSSNVNEFGRSSSARYSTTQHSIDSSAVYPPSSRESGQYVQDSDVLRSHSLSTTGTQYSLSHSTEPLSPTSFPPASSNGNNQVRRQSIGKKRKPAPVYNPSTDEHNTSAILSLPALQHSSTTNTESSILP